MDKVNTPESFERPERFKWIDDETLRVQDKKLSITELEIFHGLLGRREDNQDCKRVFVYFRDDQEFIAEVNRDMRWIFDFEHISEEDVQTRHMTNSKLFTIRSRHLARDARRGTEMRQIPSKVSISSFFYRR